ncbi:MAG TPA: phosphomannomutase/phosphoglucomutase [Candidatus Magasanikbacteria bacterium]|nr:phosphomannomutase/phosphoglucomutase [Candidatus Magasanikbacteria bacterium]
MTKVDTSLFRNYDIRGEFGVDLTVEAGYIIARAYAKYAQPKKVVVGYDCRSSSPILKDEIIRGLVESGVDVMDIGMVSTDVLYFATWYYKFDGGLMITASHMPKEFNGVKFLRLNTEGMLTPIGKGVGMEELEAIAQSGNYINSDKNGVVEQKDVWVDFVNFSKSFVDVDVIKPLKVVMDAGNGMGGVVADKVFADMDLDITKLFFEPDGNFPNHQANPFEEKNRVDWVAKTKEIKPDLGVAWDADCDRVYFLDENGDFINCDYIVALLAINFLEKNPGTGVVYDLRASWVVKDWLNKLGGKGYIERVGHTYIKKRMQETKAIFGGEVSGHFYFIKNAYMENGFVPALMIMEMISKTGKTLSQLIKDLGDYYISGESNYKVQSTMKTMEKIKEKYFDAKEISYQDGMSFEFDDWHFNVRPSANDPVLRLNLEAKSKELMEEKLEEIKNIILE